MAQLRSFLVRKWGESFGQTKWVWLMQKYNVMPWEEAPMAMVNEARIA